MELRIDYDAVARARRLAAAIADPIEDFIARHATLSVERAVARLCGVDGVDGDGSAAESIEDMLRRLPLDQPQEFGNPHCYNIAWTSLLEEIHAERRDFTSIY